MRIETLLNRVFWIKSFVYAGVSIHRIGRRDAFVVDIRPRQNGLPECSRCGKAGPVYDHMPDHRQFEFIPLWNVPVYFHYTMRRVDCGTCGIRVERVPWAEGKSPVTKPFALFLAQMGLDEARVRKLCSDYQTAGLEQKDLGLLQFADKMTRGPDRMTDADVNHLKELGWTDEVILEATCIAAFFNFLNRVVNALGVLPEEA